MPTALVVSRDVDLSASVSRPKHRYNGGSGAVHRWTGTGNKAATRLPFPGHQVLSVWGSATPNDNGRRNMDNEEPETEIIQYTRKPSDSRMRDGGHTRRAVTTEKTLENMVQYPFGRRFKLVFLKDSGDIGSNWGRIQ